MKYFRYNLLRTFVCLILAILVFNISIDPPDVLKNIDNDLELEEDLSLNEIESIAELILESGFDIVNAVPESDDPDSDSFFKKYDIFESNFKSFHFFVTIIPAAKVCFPRFSPIFFSDYNFKTITPPPES